MCVCVRERERENMCVRVYVCNCLRLSACVWLNVWVCVYICERVCLCMSVCVWMWGRWKVLSCIVLGSRSKYVCNIFIHTHHSRTYPHTHTFLHTLILTFWSFDCNKFLYHLTGQWQTRVSEEMSSEVRWESVCVNVCMCVFCVCVCVTLTDEWVYVSVFIIICVCVCDSVNVCVCTFVFTTRILCWHTVLHTLTIPHAHIHIHTCTRAH
jgi:hypothetical protein